MRILRLVIVALAVVFVAIQFVPYGRDHTQPPVTQEAPWATPEARQIAVQSCYDCHSDQTKWRWYTNVAPFSWYVQNHVDDGRRALNFSEWNGRQRSRDLVEVVNGGSMPPLSYVLLHPSAKLSASEKQKLIPALQALAAQSGGRGERERG